MQIKLDTSANYTNIILPDGNYKVSSTNTAIASDLICPKLEALLQSEPGFAGATVSYNVNTFKVTISNPDAFDMIFYKANVKHWYAEPTLLHEIFKRNFFNQNLIAFHVLHYWIKLSSNFQRSRADILIEWTTFLYKVYLFTLNSIIHE